MLQVLLTILKILGIIILVILGIILTILLLVLLVPLRYRIDASFDGKPKGNVLASWLLKLVTVHLDYDGEQLQVLAKVLCFRVFQQKLWPSDDETLDEIEPVSDPYMMEDSIAPVTMEPKKTKDDAAVPYEAPKSVTTSEKVSSPTSDQKTKRASKTVRTESETQKRPDKVQTASVEAIETEKIPLAERVMQKLAAVVTGIMEKIRNVSQKLSEKYAAGQDKLEMVRTFLSDTENQNTLRLLWRQILKLLKHVLPRKIRGRVRFGFDDPATTGQILTYISPFYGMYAKTLSIEPVFEEKALDGELHIKGHIRVGTLLWIVIRVILNKNFRTLVKKFLNSRK